MLTLKAPIEITARTGYMADQEAFYRRITGSYALMETAINAEDLLHVSATPPEVYVAESDGMTSLLTHNERNETNIHKVEIINNVINRILMSADVGLTYQDRVFITDALYKLGIRDDRSFMTTFYRLAEETRNTNELINLYLSHAEDLKELTEYRERIRTEREVRTEEGSEKVEENTLYTQIMNRLMTGAVYQIVSNFNRSTEDYRIDAREYTVTPQSYIAQQILLGRLREMTGTGTPDLIYRSENRYEDAFYEGSVDENHVEQNLTSAVMLELLQNLYHTGFERFYTQNAAYYRFEDSFYRSATEVLNRISENRTSFVTTKEENLKRIDVTNRMARQEITLLNRIFQSDLSEIYEGPAQYVTAEDHRENRYHTLSNEYYEAIAGEPREAIPGEPEPLQLEDRITPAAEEERIPEPGSPEEAEAILRAVNELNVQNEMRRRQLEQIVQRVEHERVRQTPGDSMERTRADAMLALHQPEVLKERLQSQESRETVREQALMREITRILPPQGAQVYQILQQYEQNPQLFVQNQTLRHAEIGELMSDIREVERLQEKERTAQESGGDTAEQMTLQMPPAAKPGRTPLRRQRPRTPEPIQTVHRRQQTLSGEDLTETLQEMENRVTKQMKREVQEEFRETTHVTKSETQTIHEVKHQETQQINIERLVDDGVKRRMNAISDQVFHKLERRMQSEKIRRGY